jgi:serine protease AprX
VTDAAHRTRLKNEVAAVHRLVNVQAKSTGSAPMRVKLRSEAVAKTHRPDQSLFSESSCPIIGAGKLGELFVKATPNGLTRLERTIELNESQVIEKELSTVEVIEPVTAQFRRRELSSIEILKKSPRRRNGFMLQVKLFDFELDDQPKHIQEFRSVCEKRGIVFDQDGYDPASQVFAVQCKDVEDVETVSNIIGVRSIRPMPSITTLRPQVMNAASPPAGLPIASQAEGDFPVVVVVDSGISDEVPELATWIVGSHCDVAPEYRNPAHGTFVAGLICFPAFLNPTLAAVDETPCGVFDLQVIPNYDPDKGDTEFLTEQEFLINLKTALDRYANKYKVWNLSLGTTQVCSMDEFSTMAEQLDNFQEQYQVSFVISAGNYETPPLLSYPRTATQLAAGRITTPADSVLGITVGAISHVDNPNGGPKKNEPSAFSRHGAGPNYIIKPDVVHYGGGCSVDVKQRSGIRSISASGCAEDLGTSFATPLVSRSLAQIYHCINPTPTPELARALLTHHARDPRNGERVPDGQENFLGFGLPTNPPHCLECTPHSSTVVFVDTLRPGYFLEWDDFPYPPSLKRNGRYFGNIWMTIAFSPSRGSRWGTEYCQSHIEANFGVYRWIEHRDRPRSLDFKGLVPPEHKNVGELYESSQIRNLRKWAPVRTHFGSLGENGERGEKWRLKVKLLTRHGDEQHPSSSQPFSLIITIADPEGKAPVYNEMVQQVQAKYQVENLSVRAAARLRARS